MLYRVREYPCPCIYTQFIIRVPRPSKRLGLLIHPDRLQLAYVMLYLGRD